MLKAKRNPTAPRGRRMKMEDKFLKCRISYTPVTASEDGVVVGYHPAVHAHDDQTGHAVTIVVDPCKYQTSDEAEFAGPNLLHGFGCMHRDDHEKKHKIGFYGVTEETIGRTFEHAAKTPPLGYSVTVEVDGKAQLLSVPSSVDSGIDR